MKLKQFLFCFSTSTLFAIALYYLLSINSGHVFGALYRMFLYHYSHPISYILVATFSFSLIATFFFNVFVKSKLAIQIIYTLVIFLISIFVASIFGGMLWHYHDMQSGYFPSNWLNIMVSKGTSWGLGCGWFILLSSYPYNILIAIIFFFILYFGNKIKAFK